MSNTTPWPPPWYQQCLENINKIPGGKLCPPEFCVEDPIRNFMHKICTCQPPYQNGCSGINPPWPECCVFTSSSPIAIFDGKDGFCYCCCGYMAVTAGGQLSVSEDETKSGDELSPGDSVLVADDATLKTWSQKPIGFSSGSGLGIDLLRITVEAEDGARVVIADPQQLFLMPDRKLKRANKLVCGEDHLLLRDGTPLAVVKIQVEKDRGAHRVAMTSTPATTIEGHLVLDQGVVIADYALQIANLEQANPDLLVEGHASLPDFDMSGQIEAMPD